MELNILQMIAREQETESNIAIGSSDSLAQGGDFSQSLIGTQKDSVKMEVGFSGNPKICSKVQSGISGNQGSRGMKNKNQSSSCSVTVMNSSGIRSSVRKGFDVSETEIILAKQDGKKRCYEKKVENNQDLKCALKIEVIDDTAVIEASVAVSGFKADRGNGTKKIGGKKDSKRVIDAKEKKNKKQGKGVAKCLPECLNDKNFNMHVSKDQNSCGKKITEGKVQNVSDKRGSKVKIVYQRKDMKGQKLVSTGVEEQKKGKELSDESGYQNEPTTQKIEIQNAYEKFGDEVFPENEIVSAKEPNCSEGNETELTILLVESQTVYEKKDVGFNSKMDVASKKCETGEGTVCEKRTDVSKKMVYSREEMEALRFADEDKQKKKWTEVFSGFSPAVAEEYNSLVVEMNNANGGITRGAIFSRPSPVLPLCSSYYRYIPRYGHVVSR